MLDISQLLHELTNIKRSINLMIRSGKQLEAIERLQEVAIKSFELSLADVRQMPPKDLLVLLVYHRQLNGFQLFVLAELLLQEAQAHYELKKFEVSRKGFEFSTIIFQYLQQNRKKPEGFNVDTGDMIALGLDMIRKIGDK